jgi:CHAD domain-containing protein
MASYGKWIDDLTAATPVAEAARRVLDVRLGAVVAHWPAALAPTGDPEPVHQLRVATRRAAAALRAFGDLVPAKDRRKLRRALRRLRRAAGAARDADVFLLKLQRWGADRPVAEQPGLHLLAGLAVARRRDAQATLDATEPGSLPALGRLRGGGGEALGDRAAGVLPGLFAEFTDAADGDLDDPHRLHQLRIAGKRLRYALELFAGCYGPDVRDRLVPAIEFVQNLLGDAQDGHVIARTLDDALADLSRFGPPADDWREGIERWRADLDTQSAAAPARVRAWLADWNDVYASISFTVPPARPAAGP